MRYRSTSVTLAPPLRSRCDGDHKNALFCQVLPKISACMTAKRVACPVRRLASTDGRTGLNPSLDDCPGVPNSRWPWGSIAHPACGRACARSRPGGAGSARDCCRRSRTHRRMRPQPVGEGGCPGLGPSSWQSRSISALALRRRGKCACSFASPTSPSGRYPLSRSDPAHGLVHLRQRFVR